jgi:hypothetical protein
MYKAALHSNLIQRGLDYLYRLPRRAPYAVSKFTHPKVGATMASWLSDGRFDVAACDFLSASGNFPEQLKTPCVLFQHNVESSLWQRMARTQPNPVKRLSYAIESAKMTRYERAALRRFHHIVAVSEHDREQMLKMEPASEIAVVPTGVTQRCPSTPRLLPRRAGPTEPTLSCSGHESGLGAGSRTEGQLGQRLMATPPCGGIPQGRQMPAVYATGEFSHRHRRA